MQKSSGEASKLRSQLHWDISECEVEGLMHSQSVWKSDLTEYSSTPKASLPLPLHEREAQPRLEIILNTKLGLRGEKESLFQAEDFKITHRQLNFISKSHK